jgi:tetratricopeptide (TPR) repeat protein
MSDHLETLYKVLTREQTTGYSGSSVLGGFEEFLAGWCDRVLAGKNDQHVQKVLRDIKLAAEGYGTATQETRERKVAEMGRMLLSLRDILQQIPDDHYGTPAAFRGHSDPDAHKDRGMAYKQEGRFSEAIVEFEGALESNPDDHFALSHLAHIYLQRGNLEESSRLIDRALKVDPANPFVHSVKGEILFKEDNMEEAAAVFEGVLNLKTDDTYAHSKLGVIYRKQGRMKEAMSILKRGLEIDPDNPSLHHALGDVYVWLGKDEEAVAEYQRAVDLNPEDEYAFRGLLSSKVKGRDTRSIISQLQKILKIPSRRQNAHLHALLARYLKQEKQYEAAAAEFREAVKLQPRSLYFQTQLAFCYSKLGQYPRVIELLEPIHRVKSRDPLVTQALAKAYEGVGRIEDARKLLIDILYIYPNNRYLRSALMKLGKERSEGAREEE